jgi:hypothetical protein
LYNALVLLNNTNVHATLLFNMNQFKSELSVNSNDLVLPKLVHKLTFNNMVLNSLMLVHSSYKLAPLVLSKIFHHQLVHLLVSVPAHTVKKHRLVHQALTLVLVLLEVSMLVGGGYGGSSFESSSFSSGGGGGYGVAGGADSAFQQADLNRDGSIDQGEFRSFVGQNLGGAGGGGGSSSYESSSFSSSTGY